MIWTDIKSDVRKQFGTKALNWYEHNDNRIYVDIPPEALVTCSKYLFEEKGARFIIASAVDTPRGGIEIIYHFDFFQLPQVFSLRIFLEKHSLVVETLTGIIKGAEWIEREIAELFGVTFRNHPNPIHLLLPEDWPEGNYPLRRDQ